MPQSVAQTVGDEGMDTGIGSEDLEDISRCRIAIEDTMDIFPQIFPHKLLFLKFIE